MYFIILNILLESPDCVMFSRHTSCTIEQKVHVTVINNDEKKKTVKNYFDRHFHHPVQQLFLFAVLSVPVIVTGFLFSVRFLLVL